MLSVNTGNSSTRMQSETTAAGPLAERVAQLWQTVGARWRYALYIAGGVACGLGLVVVHISRAEAYLQDRPEACLNCHVMNNAYANWRHSSHRAVAECSDCHLPHQNPVAKLAFQARDGLRHSYVFTFRLEPQVLRLSDGALPVVQENCLRCHANQFMMARLAAVTERRCWDCHEGPHGDVRSLAGTPNAYRPPIPPAGLRRLKTETGVSP